MMKKLPKCYNKFSKRQLKTQLLKQMNDNILIVWENHDLNQLLHSEKQKKQDIYIFKCTTKERTRANKNPPTKCRESTNLQRKGNR